MLSDLDALQVSGLRCETSPNWQGTLTLSTIWDLRDIDGGLVVGSMRVLKARILLTAAWLPKIFSKAECPRLENRTAIVPLCLLFTFSIAQRSSFNVTRNSGFLLDRL